MSNSLWPSGLQPTRLLCPWDFPGKNIGVDCHFLLQGIFPTQGLNPHFLHWQNTIQPSIPCFCSNQNNCCLFREAVGRGRWHWLLMLENQEAHSFPTGVCRAGGQGQSQGGPYPVSPLWWLCQVGMTLQKRRWPQITEVVSGRAESTPRAEWHSLVVTALLLLENILEWAEWWRQASVISVFWRKWKLREVNYMRSRTWVAPALTGVPPTPHSTLQDCSHGPHWVIISRNVFWRYYSRRGPSYIKVVVFRLVPRCFWGLFLKNVTEWKTCLANQLPNLNDYLLKNNLVYYNFFGWTGSSLWRVGLVAQWHVGVLVCNQALNLSPLHWKMNS